MRNLLIYSFCGLLLLSGCQSDEAEVPKTFTFTGDIEQLTADALRIVPPYEGEHVEIALDQESGTFSVDVPLLEAGYVDYNIGREWHQIHVAPGDSVHMTADFREMSKTLVYSGDAKDKNNYLNKVELYNEDHRRPEPDFYSLSYEAFQDTVEQDFVNKLALIDKYADQLDPIFVATEKHNESYARDLTLMRYPGYYEHFNKGEKADTASKIAKVEILKKVDLNDEGILQYDRASSLISSVLSTVPTKVNFDELGSVKYFHACLDRAMEIENQKVREFAYFISLVGMIRFGGGLDNITTEIDEYRAFAKHPNYIAQIDKLVEKWEPLRAGNPAPAFIANHLDDSDFASGDLKGKNIYVDVWATWCGPCKVEIPHLKKIEHEYEDENLAFLSVSIDNDESIPAWKEFVKKEELGGIQVHAPNAWESDIVKEYKIEGIPRFLLIDAEGKIVSANAPRPSEVQLRETLNNLLQKG